MLEDITIRVKLDPRVVMWASTVDDHALKTLGFNSENKYTLPAQRAICKQIEEVVACINDDYELVSTYSNLASRSTSMPSKVRSQICKPAFAPCSLDHTEILMSVRHSIVLMSRLHVIFYRTCGKRRGGFGPN